MPLGRYPERVRQFSEWSRKQVADAKLSGSATPGGTKGTRKRRKKRKRKRKARDLREA